MASVSQLIEVARAERELGNDFFYQNMHGRAMRKYEKVCTYVCTYVCCRYVCIMLCHHGNFLGGKVPLEMIYSPE